MRISKIFTLALLVLSFISCFSTAQTKVYLNSENYEEVRILEFVLWLSENYNGTYDYLVIPASTEIDGVGFTVVIEQSGNFNMVTMESFLEGNIEIDTLNSVVIDGNNFTAIGKYIDWQNFTEKEGTLTGTFCTLKYKSKSGKTGSVNGLLLSYFDDGEKAFFEKIK